MHHYTKHSLFIKLVFIVAFSLHICSFIAQVGSETEFKDIKITWSEDAAYFQNTLTGKSTRIYKNVDREGYDLEDHRYESHWVDSIRLIEHHPFKDSIALLTYSKEYENSELISVVGPYVSYTQNWYYEGGAHPTYGKQIIAKSVLLDQISLIDLFSEGDLFDALYKNDFVKKYLIDSNVRELKELWQNLDGGCDFYFGGILENFAFHHLEQDQVALRIGVSYGCEIMRGNFKQISILLPIPASLEQWLFKADQKKLLMCYLEK